MTTRPWTLILAEPFDAESLTVAVRVPGEADPIALRVERGRWGGQLPGRPDRLQLAMELTGAASTDVASPQPVNVTASIEELAGEGVALPTGDAVRLTVTWAKHCHTGGPTHPRDRFGSREHIHCADRVGEVEGLGLLPDTKLTVGGSALTFGEIIALAGDFYAHLDPWAVANFADAWPPPSHVSECVVGGDYREVTLRDDEPSQVMGLAMAIERSGDPATLLDEIKQYVDGTHPTRRYLALASQNVCHFGHPRDEARNEALRLYLRYHQRALGLAHKAGVADVANPGFAEALVVEAFGCHFLTDLFASGHIRVPRAALTGQLGVLVGGLVVSKKMHDEDNRLGLWCSTRADQANPGRPVWRAFGDGFLMLPVGEVHRERVELAVCATIRELVESTCGGGELPLAERAEGMIPVPLRPGEDPYRNGAVVKTDNLGAEFIGPNHAPLCFPADRDGEERVFLRRGGVESRNYVEITKPWSAAVDYDALASD